MRARGNGAYNPKSVITYSDTSFNYVGRWTDHAQGKQTGWGGSYIIFKVKNTPYVTVNTFVNVINSTASANQSSNNDNDPIEGTNNVLHAAGTTFSGAKTSTIRTVNDGNWHTIKIHLYGLYTEQAAKNVEIVFKNIELAYGGQISAFTLGSKLIQCIGDSWMGNINDWPRLMDLNTYNVYQIASGGMKASDADSRYNYDYDGILNTTDPNADAVLVSYGVNDLLASVTVGNFQASLLSLVDKIRIKQPTAPILLIRVPSNTGVSQPYGQYLTAMNNIVGLRTNVIAVDTSSLDATMTWRDDYHVDGNGKQLLANYIKQILISNGI